MKRKALLITATALIFLLSSCSKDSEHMNNQDIDDEPRTLLTLQEIVECSEEKEWTREGLINELEGDWIWISEEFSGSGWWIDTMKHAGLKLSFNTTNKLIIANTMSIDTVYYDIREQVHGHKLHVVEDTLD